MECSAGGLSTDDEPERVDQGTLTFAGWVGTGMLEGLVLGEAGAAGGCRDACIRRSLGSGEGGGGLW